VSKQNPDAISGQYSADGAHTAGPWTHLSWFQVTYLDRSADNTTASVFRNGRQQVPIKIVIEARDANNQVVALSTTDLQRLRLVLYNTGQSLPANSVVRTTRDTLYDYYPEGGIFSADYAPMSKQAPTAAQINEHLEVSPSASVGILDIGRRVLSVAYVALFGKAPTTAPISDEQVELVRSPCADTTASEQVRIRQFISPHGVQVQAQEWMLWLRTTSSDTLRVAGTITAPNASVFHTHSRDVAAGGAPSGGKFNSSVTVVPQLPRQFPHTSFRLSRSDWYSSSRTDIDIYEVWIADTSYKLKKTIRYMQYYNTGWWYAHVNGKHNIYHYGANETRTSYTHRVLSNETTITFPVNGSLDQGKISLARVLDIKDYYYYEQGGVGIVGFVDNFGNESILWIRGAEGGNVLYLADS